MILPSTIRKLQARGENVVRVLIPAHVVAFPTGEEVPFPERKDYFATASGAAGFCANWNPAQFGVKGADPIVTTLPAAQLDPLFGVEITDLGAA